jgi:hypothetical protein
MWDREHDMAESATHSDIVGGSTAARLLACPGSYSLIKKLPAAALETDSAYASEGTALHEVMAKAINGTMSFRCAGTTMSNGVTITERMVNDLLDLTASALDGLIPDDEQVKLLTELQVEFPGIKGAFGTLDLCIATRDRLAVIDFKFGKGVHVKAIYPDDEKGDLLNAQLLFYACALRNSYPQLFNGVETIELGIVQPAFGTSMVVVELNELDAFEVALKKAVKVAKGKNPPMTRGDHCRFAPCKAICPHWTAPLFDANLLARALESRGKSTGEDYGIVLAAGLRAAPLIEALLAEYRAQAYAYLDAGHEVPGFKLVPKRAVRKWNDEATAESALHKLGLPITTIITSACITPAAAEKALKSIKKELPGELWSAVSSGSTVAPADDSRSEQPTLSEAIEDMATAVSALLRQENEL